MRVRIQSAALVCTGALLVFVLHRRILVSAICAVGLFLLIVGQFYSPLARALETLNRKTSSLVASTLGWILLAPFYIIFFSIGHALLSVRGKDPLHLNSTTDESTYWLPVPPEPPGEDYRRQY